MQQNKFTIVIIFLGYKTKSIRRSQIAMVKMIIIEQTPINTRRNSFPFFILFFLYF